MTILHATDLILFQLIDDCFHHLWILLSYLYCALQLGVLGQSHEQHGLITELVTFYFLYKKKKRVMSLSVLSGL